MSDPYERAIGGRLVYKSGTLATLKTIDKNKHRKKKKKKTKDENSNQSLSDEGHHQSEEAGEGSGVLTGEAAGESAGEAAGEVYTIDAAKRMKYDELFPVEAKKFGYDPKSKSKPVEDALDDRVKKKADRYCK